MDSLFVDDLPQGVDDLGSALFVVDDLRHPFTVHVYRNTITI